MSDSGIRIDDVTAHDAWIQAAANPQATVVRLVSHDHSLRFLADELGILVLNDYAAKYDARVWLAPRVDRPWTQAQQENRDSVEAGSFLATLLENEDVRVFYFDVPELDYVRGPGFGPIRPGHRGAGLDPDSDKAVLARIVAHDAAAGL